MITYRSYAEGYPPPPREDPNVGRTDGCVDPSSLRNLTRYSGSYFPTSSRHPAFDVNVDFGVTVDTPYILVRDLYTGECRADANGDEYLSIAYDPAPPDTRINGVNFDHWLLTPASIHGPGAVGRGILDPGSGYLGAGFDSLRAFLRKASLPWGRIP